MARTYFNVIVHLVFHTKSTACVMKEEDLSRIFQYIGGIARDMTGYVYKVGGMTDHVHILTPLSVTISISDFVRTIKANTSKWIKSLNEDYKDFAWQEGYGVFSVSESSKHDVIQYIENQKLHHKKRTAIEELLLFLEKNGYDCDAQTSIVKKRDV